MFFLSFTVALLTDQVPTEVNKIESKKDLKKKKNRFEKEVYTISCGEMRKSKCIINARVGYDGDDLSEDNHYSFDPKIKIFGCRALPVISSRAYGRSNFQFAQILFLNANSESA